MASAPSAFQKLLSTILADCEGTVHLIDDVIVHGKTKSEHDKRLEKVMRQITKYNLTLNQEKCEFAKSTVNFIGYKILDSGILPLQSNVEGLQKVPEPRNQKELKSFLASSNFYLKFVPGYAVIAEPLRKLLRKDVEWTWTETHTSAVNEIKQRIMSPPVLAYFNPELPTIVTCDSSQYAVGCHLSQMHNGIEKPVAFASRSLSEVERKYSASEREALACIFACEHWHIYLYGRKFVLRTDHEALKCLLLTSGSGHKPLRIYRWSDRLLEYNFTVEHVRGQNNVAADMLSRLTIEKVKSTKLILI